MNKRIYLDHNATTPVAEEVLEEMLPFLKGSFGNPSSIHAFGQDAKRALSLARQRVASFIGADVEEIVFTSGGTESNNLAISGAFEALHKKGSHFVTSAVEHEAVLEFVQALEKRGAGLTRVGVDEEGRVDPAAVDNAITDKTILVSVMLANNEVGAIQPVKQICDIAHAKNTLVHCDAVQGAGKIEFSVGTLDVDLASISSHKIYGPKGVGALYVKRGTPFTPLPRGGGQESGRRGGTENIPGIVGFGKACELAKARLENDIREVTELRALLQDKILKGVSSVLVNAARAARLPGTLSISFKGIEGDALIMALDLNGIAASTGSACSAGSLKPSYVLTAMGRDSATSRSTVRFSLGRSNSQEDIEHAADVIVRTANRLCAAQKS